GSLQYLTFTRPDVSYAVQHVCLYTHDNREPHFSALKQIFSAVYLSSNPVHHQRTKRTDIDIYFVRDLIAAG
nr:retrotransposon protein, putative, unclassified [Tanacetum cinerariifolium]